MRQHRDLAPISQGLTGFTAEEFTEIEVGGMGFNLHWPGLYVDPYVPALVAGVFRAQAWMAKALAHQAGSKTSVAKASAARANDAKGGRSRKRAAS